MKAKHLMWTLSFLLLLGAVAQLHAQQTEADRKRFEESKVKAENRDASGQYNLGVCYYRGEGVAKDAAEAVKFFSKAAQQGFAKAECNLGVCYLQGVGVARDAAEAVKWFRKAAGHNLATAQYNLGVCYAKGEGVTRDYVEAYKWVSLASHQQHENAEKSLAVLGENMTREQIVEAQRLARKFKPHKTPEPDASSLGQPLKL